MTTCLSSYSIPVLGHHKHDKNQAEKIRCMILNLHPVGPLDVPPSGGGRGVETLSLLTRLLDFIARNGKLHLKAHQKVLQNYSSIYFAMFHIEVSRGHQRSNFTNFHISLEVCHYFRNCWAGGRGKAVYSFRTALSPTCHQN